MRVVVLAERKPHARSRRARLRSERSSDDHLRGRESQLTLGKARRHRVPGRVEVRMLGVDARVDDPDLDSLARGVERRSPERGGADLLRCGFGLRGIAPGGQDVANAMQSAEACDVVSGQREREAVRDEPVAPPDSRRRDLRFELLAECVLLGVDPLSGSRGARERRRGEKHHDLRRLTAGRGQGRRADHEKGRHDGDPDGCDAGHRGVRRPKARIVRPRGCGGIGRRARFRSVCP